MELCQTGKGVPHTEIAGLFKRYYKMKLVEMHSTQRGILVVLVRFPSLDGRDMVKPSVDLKNNPRSNCQGWDSSNTRTRKILKMLIFGHKETVGAWH